MGDNPPQGKNTGGSKHMAKQIIPRAIRGVWFKLSSYHIEERQYISDMAVDQAEYWSTHLRVFEDEYGAQSVQVAPMLYLYAMLLFKHVKHVDDDVDDDNMLMLDERKQAAATNFDTENCDAERKPAATNFDTDTNFDTENCEDSDDNRKVAATNYDTDDGSDETEWSQDDDLELATESFEMALGLVSRYLVNWIQKGGKLQDLEYVAFERCKNGSVSICTYDHDKKCYLRQLEKAIEEEPGVTFKHTLDPHENEYYFSSDDESNCAASVRKKRWRAAKDRELKNCGKFTLQERKDKLRKVRRPKTANEEKLLQRAQDVLSPERGRKRNGAISAHNPVDMRGRRSRNGPIPREDKLTVNKDYKDHPDAFAKWCSENVHMLYAAYGEVLAYQQKHEEAINAYLSALTHLTTRSTDISMETCNESYHNQRIAFGLAKVSYLLAISYISSSQQENAVQSIKLSYQMAGFLAAMILESKLTTTVEFDQANKYSQPDGHLGDIHKYGMQGNVTLLNKLIETFATQQNVDLDQDYKDIQTIKDKETTK